METREEVKEVFTHIMGELRRILVLRVASALGEDADEQEIGDEIERVWNKISRDVLDIVRDAVARTNQLITPEIGRE